MSSSSSIKAIKITYLYVKRHSITKKCYFGKTTKDPLMYLGSGKYWKRHIRKYGKEFVETLWFKGFTDKEELTRIALLFSEQQDIVNSNIWLNMIPENGLDGGSAKGRKLSSSTVEKMSISQKGRHHSEVTKNKMSAKLIGNKRASGHKHSIESRNLMSQALKGKKHSKEHKFKNSQAQLKRPIIGCPHCHKEGPKSSMVRWHFDNCKYRSKE